MGRKKALISLTVFETKNEMRVHTRFARTCNIFRVTGVIVRMPYHPSWKVRWDNSICGKKMVKKFQKLKKPKRPRRSVRRYDEDLNDCACEDSFVKLANVKSVKKCSPGKHSETPTRTLCVSRYIASGEVKWGDVKQSISSAEPQDIRPDGAINRYRLQSPKGIWPDGAINRYRLQSPKTYGLTGQLIDIVCRAPRHTAWRGN